MNTNIKSPPRTVNHNTTAEYPYGRPEADDAETEKNINLAMAMVFAAGIALGLVLAVVL